MAKYNHMMDVSFSIDTTKDWEDLSKDELIEALEGRIQRLKDEENTDTDAFSHCDSYEIEKEVK